MDPEEEKDSKFEWRSRVMWLHRSQSDSKESLSDSSEEDEEEEEEENE
jgi:hypothetical protein